MAWTKNGTPDTLGSAGIPSITDLTAKKFNVFISHLFPDTGNDLSSRYNNNSNSVYATRRSSNGAADGTFVSQTGMTAEGNMANDGFNVVYVCSISGEEKLQISYFIGSNTTGAANAPSRIEFVGKFVPSPDADITRIDNFNPDISGDFATSSNLSALGTD
jgi:hypothetical protein